MHAELFSNSFDVMFWKQCKYIQLKTLAAKIYSCFSSTYTCQATFSALETIKSKHRCSLSDKSLEALLICAVSEIEPRYIQIIESSDFRVSNK